MGKKARSSAGFRAERPSQQAWPTPRLPPPLCPGWRGAGLTALEAAAGKPGVATPALCPGAHCPLTRALPSHYPQCYVPVCARGVWAQEGQVRWLAVQSTWF